MRRLLAYLLLLLAVSARSQNPSYGGKLKPDQAVMDVRHYGITLTLDIPQRSLTAETVIDLNVLQPTGTLGFDLMDDYTVRSVLVNGRPAGFQHAHHYITVTTPASLPAGPATVRIRYDGKPHVALRPPWEDGFTWATDSLGHPWVAVTAEGTGGKIFFPCKDHPSDEPEDGVDLTVTVPRNLVVAGPGLLQPVVRRGSQATYHWKTRYPINNYSVVFNVGDYRVVSREYTTIDGHRVPMQFYVLSYHAGRAPHHLELLERMARVKEKYFGEYPWAREKIGIVETPHLGMEHQTMNAYGNQFHYTQVGGEDFDWLMNHEFGHEWWGNKVTARDWADYWIHEGIGSYGDALYIEEKEGYRAYVDHFRQLLPGIRNDKPIVQGKDMEEEAAYIPDIYSKGAFFMHTLRYVVGDSLFFPALKQLATDSLTTYTHQITTDDVEQLFSHRTGMDLKPLFDFYLRTTQKLEIHIRQTRTDQYRIWIGNFDGRLPVAFVTDRGTQQVMLGQEGILVPSTITPTVDPDAYYIKRVIIE
ncbi:MAG TPA: M1 family metallopeptidase [Chitinophagaceae bacterium]|nr:M1 family metallopeptidase [Chitinophagaceae bacterium]